ncbi:hypothetical protein [Bacillus sp. MRMR6]|uniref:hypothetical protein n=1 Tax=Bacillus sp. MRMR6 TaxID=1928617 RepID=UPI0009522F16|nr:hypothetical protein [Bacillus sp. MRMR6]OLS33393.1 hypothetical protein BTR25_26075 [Bacillus sp. MRMR6]
MKTDNPETIAEVISEFSNSKPVVVLPFITRLKYAKEKLIINANNTVLKYLTFILCSSVKKVLPKTDFELSALIGINTL